MIHHDSSTFMQLTHSIYAKATTTHHRVSLNTIASRAYASQAKVNNTHLSLVQPNHVNRV